MSSTDHWPHYHCTDRKCQKHSCPLTFKSQSWKPEETNEELHTFAHECVSQREHSEVYVLSFWQTESSGTGKEYEKPEFFPCQQQQSLKPESIEKVWNTKDYYMFF